MNQYALFLRAVNVGGNNIINMNELKESLIRNNFENVKTWINSGNICLSQNLDKETALRKTREIIETRFKIKIEMILKTKKEINEIIQKEPFNERENDNSKKIVVLLSENADKNKVSQFKYDKLIDENYYHCGDLIYIYYHNGAGRSKFTNNYIEKKLNLVSTARNWNTILKIRSLLEEQ